ncbi:MAG TPA: serine/threonine-protein kinase [Haliangiales bacterium]|nr:serine/threonine-protein kinase [Haliangiales bacterium]
MSLLRGMLIDRYRIREPLGSGAMGEVYLAEDDGLRRKVALKILSDHHRDNAELRARFSREARAAAALSHPNVVQVYTIGEFDGRPWFAMEHLVGRDLGSIVKREGPLDSLQAATVALDAARGLEAAAAAGLIHRDVKPANLVRLDAGGVKVTDFGLVKPVSDAALTAAGVVVGTPDYIAPEQARGEAIDARVDIYALGCTLYYLLTGRAPFRRGNPDEDKYLKVVARHLKEPAPDVRLQRPEVDGELAALILTMMAKDPAARPGYEELIGKLERIAARLRGEDVPAESSPSITRVLAPARKSRAWLWAILAFAALAGVGIWGLGRREPAPAPPPGTTVPAGMVLIMDGDGAKPVCFVDRAAVTNRAYAEIVPSHVYAAADADKPVVGIPFDRAKEYAHQRERRLVYAQEWPLLREAVVAPGRLWEWVDDGTTGRDRAVRRADGGGEERRKIAGDKTVTFRLALDAP